MALNVTRISSVEYLQSTVMVGDSAAGTSMTGRGLTAYYTESGNPPGRWYGSGVPGLSVSSGEDIGSADAIAVWQKFRSPRTNERLGRPPLTDRNHGATVDDNQLAESTSQTRRDVAGFDLTFTIPKDASILWALGDPALQARIARCHERALHATLDHLEDSVLQSRAGHGGVAAVAVKGLIAGQWDHWDSRDGEPHLHSHVVVSNRVQRASDGQWVTIDSRALFRATVALSELHQNLLMDEMHRELGVQWTEREGVTSRAAVPDIIGMPTAVRDAFSSRTAAIERDLEARVERFREENEREPTHRELLGLKQSAWRATRRPKDKDVMPLSDRCEQWRRRASEIAADTSSIIDSCVHRDREVALTGDVSSSVHEVLVALTVDSLGRRQRPDPEDTDHDGAPEDHDADRQARLLTVSGTVLGSLTTTRSTWTAANVRAEVERVMRLVRASSPEVRAAAVEAITEEVLDQSIQLTPTRYRVLADDPQIALRGRAVFDDAHRATFTSLTTLDREESLLASLNTPGAVDAPEAPLVDDLVDSYNETQLESRGHALASDQDAAVRAILTADTRTSVLIGPAGTGKTTTMAAVRELWETLHHGGSVVGLATSAQAASVLGEEIGTEAHTVAKWLHESTAGQRERAERTETLTAVLATLGPQELTRADAVRRQIARLTAASDAWRLHPGQLIVVDEASMTSTAHLHQLTQQADAAGARVLLVGDHRQLDAVEAGGALGLLAEQSEALELTSVWRFHESWEKDASLRLRHVHDDAAAKDLIALYEENDRLVPGDDETVSAAAFDDTRAAISAGRSAILIAATNAVVADTNARFMHARRESGEVDATRTVPLRGNTDAGIGERILTRHNDRRLLDSQGDFIRNGTTLVIEGIRPDGSAVATRDGTGATISLPADYLTAHTELGYATTAHRSQGVTVDEARLLLPTTDSIPAELLYVGLTRGRSVNMAYIGHEKPAEDPPTDGHIVAAAEMATWRGRFSAMMTLTGAEQSATTARARITRELGSLSTLRNEYEYLTSLTDPAPLVNAMVDQHHLDRTTVEESPILASLAAAHRAAIATSRHEANVALTAPVRGVEPSDTEAQLRVITARLRKITSPLPTVSAATVAGLMPRYGGGDHAITDLAAQVEGRMTARITQLTATAAHQPWAAGLPHDDVVDLAIYRDLYDVRGESPLGPPPDKRDTRQRAHFDALAQRDTILAGPTSPGTGAVSGPDHGPAATFATPRRPS